MSSWAQYLARSNQFWIKPCPSFPYQWYVNEVAPFSIVRAQAFYETINIHEGIVGEQDSWYLANSIMALGWIAVTLPEILATSVRLTQVSGPCDSHRQGVYYKNFIAVMKARFPDLIERDATDIILLARSDKAWSESCRGVRITSRVSRLINYLLHFKKDSLAYPCEA